MSCNKKIMTRSEKKRIIRNWENKHPHLTVHDDSDLGGYYITKRGFLSGLIGETVAVFDDLNNLVNDKWEKLLEEKK